MAVPDYRVKLTRLMLRSAYRPPPEDNAAWDGLYNGHPFVIGADMDLRRIDTAVRTAKQHGCLPIALAALEGQGSAVLLRRYADPGYATVYKVTDHVLAELLGRTPSLYTPPRTQFITEKGDVVDAPLIKAPGKLEDRIANKWGRWYERNKARVPLYAVLGALGWYFYGMLLNSLKLGRESVFNTTGEEVESIWVLNPFRNLFVVLTPFGLGVTAVIFC